MAEIQGAVVAADINDDGKIELVTADAHGNVAAWTPQGKEIWVTHVKSLVPQVICDILTPTYGCQHIHTLMINYMFPTGAHHWRYRW